MSGMVHLRIVTPPALAPAVLEALDREESVVNVVVLPGAARRPAGDVVLCDVAREDASLVIAELREAGVGGEQGSIALEGIDTAISRAADRAVRAAPGSPADAVVWEELATRTQEDAELSVSFLAFMMLATVIAAVGIYEDSAILIIGAMIVGPDFGPIAGLCVAAVQRRGMPALRSFLALAVGFPAGITAAFAATLVFQASGALPDDLAPRAHSLAAIISSPGFFTFFVAFCAGIAGILSLTSAKSGALVGVLVSVTTIPAAANIGVAAAYGDWSEWRGSMAQLAINLATLVVAGLLTVWLQRAVYRRRLVRHRNAERG